MKKHLHKNLACEGCRSPTVCRRKLHSREEGVSASCGEHSSSVCFATELVDRYLCSVRCAGTRGGDLEHSSEQTAEVAAPPTAPEHLLTVLLPSLGKLLKPHCGWGEISERSSCWLVDSGAEDNIPKATPKVPYLFLCVYLCTVYMPVPLEAKNRDLDSPGQNLQMIIN